MIFTSLDVPGPVLVELERRSDERGSFARSYDVEEFRAAGLVPDVVQVNVATNVRAGTVRGMHWQAAPAQEAKLVRCTRGALLDVAVDVRDGSPTRLRHVAVELRAGDGRMLYVPPGFAHGYQVLEDDTEVQYQVSAPYTPAAERGLRPDDPALGIAWPLPFTLVSDKDRGWPLLDG